MSAAAPELLDHLGDLGERQRSRRLQLLPAVDRIRLTNRRDRRRTDGELTTVKVRVRHAPDVPELGEDPPASLVYGVGHHLQPATCSGEWMPGVRM